MVSAVLSNNLARRGVITSLYVLNRRSTLPVLVFQTKKSSTKLRPALSSGKSADARPQASRVLQPAFCKAFCLGLQSLPLHQNMPWLRQPCLCDDALQLFCAADAATR